MVGPQPVGPSCAQHEKGTQAHLPVEIWGFVVMVHLQGHVDVSSILMIVCIYNVSVLPVLAKVIYYVLAVR